MEAFSLTLQSLSSTVATRLRLRPAKKESGFCSSQGNRFGIVMNTQAELQRAAREVCDVTFLKSD